MKVLRPPMFQQRERIRKRATLHALSEGMTSDQEVPAGRPRDTGSRENKLSLMTCKPLTVTMWASLVSYHPEGYRGWAKIWCLTSTISCFCLFVVFIKRSSSRSLLLMIVSSPLVSLCTFHLFVPERKNKKEGEKRRT